MASTRFHRRLAAILVIDMVGYSRLVEQDEQATLSGLSDLRRLIIGPLFAEYRGRGLELTGDGALAEFGSVVDAVACARRSGRGGGTAGGGRTGAANHVPDRD